MTTGGFRGSAFNCGPRRISRCLHSLTLTCTRTIGRGRRGRTGVMGLIRGVGRWEGSRSTVHSTLLVTRHRNGRVLSRTGTRTRGLITRTRTRRSTGLTRVTNSYRGVGTTRVRGTGTTVGTRGSELGTIMTTSGARVRLRAMGLGGLGARIARFGGALVGLLTRRAGLTVRLPRVASRRVRRVIGARPRITPIRRPTPTIRRGARRTPTPMGTLTGRSGPMEGMTDSPGFNFNAKCGERDCATNRLGFNGGKGGSGWLRKSVGRYR